MDDDDENDDDEADDGKDDDEEGSSFAAEALSENLLDVIFDVFDVANRL